MSNQTLFYTLGICLVVAALVVSAIGLRFPSFPSNRGVLAGVIAIFIALVGATATFAVLNAQDEQAKKEAEAAASTTSSTTTPATTSTSTSTSTTASSTTSTTGPSSSTSTSAASGPGGTVKISADPSGQLAFQQKSVTSKPGDVTIDFTNQSPVGHDVRVSDSKGNDLGGTDLVTGGSATATVTLPAGTYTFFCNVPGHEQAGMKGTLVVK